MSRFVVAILANVLGLMVFVSPSSASGSDKPACNLRRLASLELVTEPTGGVSVPAAIDGVDGLLAVDTGGINSLIGQSVVTKLGLEVSSSQARAVMFGGFLVYQMTQPKRLLLGQIVSTDIPMLVVPTSLLRTDAIGMLAPNYLSHFDIEFDFAGGKFNIFSQDHCAGQVVYWTQSAYTTIPFEISGAGHIIVTATLDGKEIHAIVDTGADRSTMTMDRAHSLFGIRAGDAALKLIGDIMVNASAPTRAYRFSFSSLNLNGVQIQNPNIDILTGSRFQVGDADMILGIQTLRQLHLYIAYKEQVLYATPVEAK